MSASERLTTVVSTKGQVILPKAVRQHRDWPAGTKLVVEEVMDGVLLRRAPLFEVGSEEARSVALALASVRRSN